MSTETIFVSYSSKDRPFALGLVKELQKLGANVWIDQLGIKLGENWDNAIEEALEKSETLMLILSPKSVESPNVQDEVSIAINSEKKLVPILIEECKLPMRWQRRQYADIVNNPDKAIHDILAFLGLEEQAAANLKEVLKLIGASEAPIIAKSSQETPEDKKTKVNSKDLLVSVAEIDRASTLHKKGIVNNRNIIIIVAIISVLLFAILRLTNILTISPGLAGAACLALNFLSIAPFGGMRKRKRYIDLMELLKLKRERLLRVMNKLTDEQIEEFNSEFYSYIKI